MIKPINGHVLIDPVPRESFIASDRNTYQEIGVVIDADDYLLGYTPKFSSGQGTSVEEAGFTIGTKIKAGDRVYFDAWLAAKYPKNDKEFYWLVKYEDIRAIENEPVSE